MKQVMVKSVISLGCLFFIFSFSACKTPRGVIPPGWVPKPKILHPAGPKKVAKGGPPPHAPAHGYRAKHNYRYYPSACVYFDISRKVYFHLVQGAWQISVSLPRALQLQLGNFVSIEMDTDKPYTKFKDHKRKYPPGQLKKKNKKWAKYK